MKKLDQLLRNNIRDLQPYSCARDEFKGEASIYMDANENPYNAPYNRYPDPQQWELKHKLSNLKNIPVENIFLGNGSDEAIDLLYRGFCEPRLDNVVAIEPTYGMYKVSASINDVEYRTVLLDDNFQFSSQSILDACDVNTKLVWLCSPNNPTGNNLDAKEILSLLNKFEGIVVVDEAYIDFAGVVSFSSYLNQYPNLVILQTLSKAWGSAAIRLGMAFASSEIVSVLNKIKYPYNVNLLTQEFALDVLNSFEKVHAWVEILLDERKKLIRMLEELPLIQHVFPTDANFVLVKVSDPNALYNYLVNQSIIVRNRNSVKLCNGCIRITVGTPNENAILIEELEKFGI
jgi:histidinol-phosphate aminotransferase